MAKNIKKFTYALLHHNILYEIDLNDYVENLYNGKLARHFHVKKTPIRQLASINKENIRDLTQSPMRRI